MTETEWEEKLAEVQKHSEHWYGMYKKLETEYTDLKEKIEKIKTYLAYEIPHEFVNEATTKIWKML